MLRERDFIQNRFIGDPRGALHVVVWPGRSRASRSSSPRISLQLMHFHLFMNRILKRQAGASGILAGALVLSACGGTVALQSSVPQSPIEIDGSEQDWYEHLRPIEKQRASIGVGNDAEHLYVAFLTADDALIRRIMALGLILWLDPGGGNEKDLGIRYPSGMMGSAGEGMMSPGDPGREASPELRREQFEASLQELDLLRGEDGESLRMSAASIPGLAVRVTAEGGIFFYELRLPLRATGPFAVAAGVDPGEALGLGLETGAVDSDVLRRQMAERAADRMGGAAPGMGPGMGGPSGRMGAGDRILMEEPFRVWRSVTLAE